ncbi:hypothetical protein B0H66DRAFT_563288 [Apodospora peruviana]|uniref:Uncharacterized protein n=1 Tax=Apodospora peruviana TaxID=516989 RepID=A0AAE0HXY7_9PEZI|nr:hypothetical protein B0H66DRAFT_563288 [Apodospora peruviana]
MEEIDSITRKVTGVLQDGPDGTEDKAIAAHPERDTRERPSRILAFSRYVGNAFTVQYLGGGVGVLSRRCAQQNRLTYPSLIIPVWSCYPCGCCWCLLSTSVGD